MKFLLLGATGTTGLQFIELAERPITSATAD
jgi:hypothetical protein